MSENTGPNCTTVKCGTKNTKPENAGSESAVLKFVQKVRDLKLSSLKYATSRCSTEKCDFLS